ncbi:MAG TPA: lmo0937 family membrane protein [Gemmatimonadales bacterium]|nr:lmo0937 family membrane protein [Gemmatimonadales bacterium]
MFATLAFILIVAWLLGFGVFHVAGGLIHLLLVLAVISILWHLITGRRSSI